MNAQSLTLTNIEISYGSVAAVCDLSMTVGAGELVALLGPSGSGKSTLLRAIAGYVLPDGGRIILGGEDVTERPAQSRNIGMVFQNYALFPHMTVNENIAFALRIRKKPVSFIRERVGSMLEMVHLSDFGNRRPHQLSGGQQQRVALARALAFEPRLLLLDEPLGALDLHMRAAMQIEIRRIQQQLGITAILVTHDQGEALAMADRVAVMNHGRLEQSGSPGDLYENPRTAFVASFVGRSNLFPVTVVKTPEGGVVAQLRESATKVAMPRELAGHLPIGSYLLSIRQEHVSVSTDPAGAHLAGLVSGVQYVGTHYLLVLKTEAGATILARDNRARLIGDKVFATFAPDKIRLLPPDEVVGIEGSSD